MSAPGCHRRTTPIRSRSGSPPHARVVYVDNDPIVLAHARALLTSSPEGATAYVDADLRDSARILTAAEILDLTKPVALMLLGILGHIGSDEEPASIVHALLDGLPSGSYLVIADGVNTSQAGNQAQARYNEQAPNPYHLRSPEQVAALFTGLQLVEPGVVPSSEWRPDPEAGTKLPGAAVRCGVAIKP
jgi:S-adenosyl methyltransferase